MTAGEPFGLVHVGALAYPTSGVESGWIAAPVPAVYTGPGLAEYRRHLGLYTFEGQNPLHGSFFSEDIEDYYVSPWELGYGRSISLGHDFIGRDALRAARNSVHAHQGDPGLRPRGRAPGDPAGSRHPSPTAAPSYLTARAGGRGLPHRLTRPGERRPRPGDHRQPVRRTRHAADGRLGRASRPGHRPRGQPRLSPHPRHRPPGPLQRSRPHRLPHNHLTRAPLAPRPGPVELPGHSPALAGNRRPSRRLPRRGRPSPKPVPAMTFRASIPSHRRHGPTCLAPPPASPAPR